MTLTAILAGTIGGFLVGFFSAIPLTGPIAVMVLRRALAGRFRAAFGLAVGGATGELVYLGMAIAGVGTLIEKVPVMAAVLEGVSAAVLVVVGLYFLFAELKIEDRDAEPHGESNAFGPSFAQGASLAILNPAILLNWTATVAIFYSVTTVSLKLIGKVLFVPAEGLGTIAWYTIVLFIVRRWRRYLSDRTIMWMQRAMGVFVLIVAGWVVRGLIFGSGRL